MIDLLIDESGKKILAMNVPYRDKDRIKLIHGCHAKYDKSVTPPKFIGWNLPLTMDACIMMRQTFGRELRVHNELTAWARLELQRQSAMEEIRSGTPAELTRIAELHPNMFQAMTAREYQLVGTSFIVHGQHVILGDDPGLGKTIQTLGALVEKGCRRILVCCPKTTARPVWCEETNFWTPTIMPFVAQGTHGQREQVIQAFEEMSYTGPKMLIINTEMIRAKKHWQCTEPPPGKNVAGYRLIRVPGKRNMQWDPPLPVWDQDPEKPTKKFCGCPYNHEHRKFVTYLWPQLMAQQWDAIVMDESHQFLASMYNIQSKNITQGRLGAVHLRRRIAPNGITAALSGTPFRSDLRKAWGTLNWLRPDVFTSFHAWAQGHFDYEEEDPGKPSYGMPEYEKKPRNPERFNAELRPYLLAREKATVASDLPPVQFMGTMPPDNREDGLKAVWLELTPEQHKAIKEIEDLGEARLPGGKLLVNGTLAEITRKRQLASAYGRMDGRTFVPTLPSNKIEWLIEFLMEHQGHDTKVVIASEFTQMCDLVQQAVNQELAMETLAITGKVTGRKRDEAVARFQDVDDPCKVMVLNMEAGGVGITLDAADYMILLDVPWKSDTEKQVVDRIHRVSRVHNVFVYRILSLGTVDEWMGSLTEEQRRILRSASPEAIELSKEVRGVRYERTR